jgi:hypothetical protein
LVSFIKEEEGFGWYGEWGEWGLKFSVLERTQGKLGV